MIFVIFHENAGFRLATKILKFLGIQPLHIFSVHRMVVVRLHRGW